MSPSQESKRIDFGILLIPFQATDVTGPVDILTLCSPPMLASLAAGGHPLAAAVAPSDCIDVKFHYIGETMDPVATDTGFNIIPTTTVEDCPELDYLLVGGPDPGTFKLGEGFAKFLRNFVEKITAHEKVVPAVGKQKGLFTTCTGAVAIAPSGVLDGRRATTNHAFLKVARALFPATEWVKEQWVEDGPIWTSGGAIAGMDMFSHWIIENYGLDLAKIAFHVLDFQPRGKDGRSCSQGLQFKSVEQPHSVGVRDLSVSESPGNPTFLPFIRRFRPSTS